MGTFLRTMMANFGVLTEMMAYLWRRKMWWLMPLFLLLMAFGLILVFASASGLGPFIYTLF